MFSKFTAAVAALSLVAVGAAGSARAQSFEDFMTVCEATSVESGAVRKAAEALGWRAVSDSMLKAFASDDEDMPFVPTFAMVAPGDAVGMLIYATAEMPMGEDATVDADLCIMATESLSPNGARQRFEQLKMAEMFDDGEGMSFMVYSRGPNGVRDERALADASEEEIARVARERPLFMLGSVTDPTLLLMTARVRGDK